MASAGLSEYQIAFLIGMSVIWIFAWKQFTQPSYERYRRFDEILQLLRPQDLRSSGVFFPAYVFYALILSGLYWVLCTFGSLQLLHSLGLNALGIDSPGTSVGALLPESWSDPSVLVDLASSGGLTNEVTRVFAGERDIARNPTVPLTIALAIVGVIPNVKFFVKFEEKLRVIAHRLAGIPGRLFEGTRFLAQADLRPRSGIGATQAAAAKDVRELLRGSVLTSLESAAGIAERDVETAKKILFKVYFFRELLAGRRSEISWPSYAVQSAYQPVSDRIVGMIGELDRELDKLRKLAAPFGNGTSAPTEDQKQEIQTHWDSLMLVAARIESDICVLLLVFAEKDGPPSERTPASAQLRNFILRAHHAAARDTIGFNVFINILVAIVTISALFGLLFGFDPAIGQDRDLSRIVSYVVTALMTYTFATIVALAYRQVTLDTTWSSVYREHWIRALMQLLVVFMLASAITFFSLCVWNIYVSVQTIGNIVIVEHWERVVRGALRQEWAAALLGGIFAVFMIVGMDFWDSRSRAAASGAKVQIGIGPAILGGFVLGIWGAAVIVIRAWQNGQSLNASHLVTNGALAFLIGAISGAVVQATLRSVDTDAPLEDKAETMGGVETSEPQGAATPAAPA